MKAMDIDAVKAFVLAADLQSFTRAADVLDTTQSAISLKLRKLEEKLGRRLLERTPRRVRLSAEGIAFLGVARELVAAHERAAAAFEIERRRLAIGINQQLVGGELPALLRRMRDHDPNLTIEMHVAGTQELMQRFERGELDTATDERWARGCGDRAAVELDLVRRIDPELREDRRGAGAARGIGREQRDAQLVEIGGGRRDQRARRGRDVLQLGEHQLVGRRRVVRQLAGERLVQHDADAVPVGCR